MKLLYVTKDDPHSSYGHVSHRIRGLMLAWQKRGWQVTLACFPKTSENIRAENVCAIPMADFPRSPIEKVSGFFNTYHFNQVSQTAIHELNRRIRQKERFDLTIAEELSMGHVLPLLENTGTRIYISHNVESDLFRQTHPKPSFRTRWQARLLKNKEKTVIYGADLVFSFSPVDRRKLFDLYDREDIQLTRSGIDTSLVSVNLQRERLRPMVFIGALDYFPNIDGLHWFANEIYPLIKDLAPVVVAGRKPGEQVRTLCRQSGFTLIDTPPDMNTVLQMARLEIVPLRIGSGTRGKIIEAFAAALPVVSTRLGAEGLEVKDGDDLLLADSPADFAHHVRRLYHDPELLTHLSRHSYATAADYDYMKVANDIADEIERYKKVQSSL